MLRLKVQGIGFSGLTRAHCLFALRNLVLDMLVAAYTKYSEEQEEMAAGPS